MKEAMKARDEVRLRTVRGLLAAFTNENVTKGHLPQDPISDEDARGVIRRAVKQHKDSIEQFTGAGRMDLVEGETAELKILEAYLPAMMPIEEIRKIATAKKTELGITDKSQAGKFTGVLMQELKDKADGINVKRVVDELLA